MTPPPHDERTEKTLCGRTTVPEGASTPGRTTLTTLCGTCAGDFLPGVTRIENILRILHRRRLAVARNRRTRERQKAGLSIAPTPYDDAVVEFLLDAGWLELSVSEQRPLSAKPSIGC